MRLLTTLVLLGVLALPAHALTTTYVDETAFKNALSSFTQHDFDGFALTEGPKDGFGFFLTLDQQIPGLDFDNARVNLGCCGGGSNSAPNVVLNDDLLGPIVITFGTLQRGVGLFNTSLVDAERFEAFDENDVLLGTIDLPHVVVNFGGFVSTEGIAKVVITPLAPTNGSIYIDDLIVSAIPLPGAALLLGPALVVLRLSGRRRAC